MLLLLDTVLFQQEKIWTSPHRFWYVWDFQSTPRIWSPGAKGIGQKIIPALVFKTQPWRIWTRNHNSGGSSHLPCSHCFYPLGAPGWAANSKISERLPMLHREIKGIIFSMEVLRLAWGDASDNYCNVARVLISFCLNGVLLSNDVIHWLTFSHFLT